MKLKNDIQVKAFLIRNKIPFQKKTEFFVIDETMIGEESLSKLKAHEYYRTEVAPKRSYNKPRKLKNTPKPSIDKLLDLNPAPENEPENTIQRVKGKYSNTQWNDL